MACFDELLKETKKEVMERIFPTISERNYVRREVLNSIIKNDGLTAHKISRDIDRPLPSVIKACKALVEKGYLVIDEVPAPRGPVEKAKIYKLGPVGKMFSIIEKIEEADLCSFFPASKQYKKEIIDKWCQDPCLREILLLFLLHNLNVLEHPLLATKTNMELELIDSFNLLISFLFRTYTDKILLTLIAQENNQEHTINEQIKDLHIYLNILSEDLDGKRIGKLLLKLGIENIMKIKEILLGSDSRYKDIVMDTIKMAISFRKEKCHYECLGLLLVEDHIRKGSVDIKYFNNKKRALSKILMDKQ